jgi:DMSO/TMAO reductase YedYZ molybdopterin-dependent catalytic subunit
MVSRRLFLAALAGGVVWSQRQQVEMIVRSARPEDLEMPFSGFDDYITPVENFFVRTHVPVPNMDISNWSLRVDGHVSTPVTLSMEDLRKLPPAEIVGVLECAGNGRQNYVPPVPGVQWANGAVGNGQWGGVRLADVLHRAGVKPGAVEILFNGADTPPGSMPDFQRTIPLKKALHPATLLAYEMNRAALPIKHGFPLRVVVPGWAGDSWLKWVTSITVLDKEYTGYWMKNAYRYPEKPVAPGSVVPPEMMRPVTSLRVKSVISFPNNGAALEIGKRTLVRGAAWTGDSGPVTSVSVSVDRGRNWKPANLTSKATEFGWRLWEFPWTPSHEGHYTLLARARDASGDVQPLVQEWNPSGYLWNVVARVDIDAGTRAGTLPVNVATPSLPQPPTAFRSTCVVCHGDDLILQQRLTRAQWDRELNKMQDWGARVTTDNRESILDYLDKLRP